MVGSGRDIQETVRSRFAQVATSPGQEKKFPVGPAVAKSVGYDPQEIDALPRSVTESFVGVHNVVDLADVHPGQTAVDLGCGAGLDSILAARRVGATGKVIGIDITEEMIAKARSGAAALGLDNVEFLLCRIEDLPLQADVADVAVSNGVFNLCPDKPQAIAEAYRVLSPGGRLVLADVFLNDNVSPEVTSRGSWCD